MKDDNALIQEFKSTGSLEVLGELYKRYMHHVFNVSYKYFKDRDDAQDAVMQIFEVLSSDLKKYEVRKFGPWLLMVTRNFCLKRLRKEQRLRKHKDGYENFQQEVVENAYEMDLSDVEQKEQVLGSLEQAIEHLNDGQRMCIELFYLQDKCYNEVAEETGFSLKEVKSYIQNGKRNLKIYMTKQHGQSI